MTTRCVLVDFGNVIAFFDHRKACRQLAALSSVQVEVNAVYAEIFQTSLEADYKDTVESRRDNSSIRFEER